MFLYCVISFKLSLLFVVFSPLLYILKLYHIYLRFFFRLLFLFQFQFQPLSATLCGGVACQ